MRDIDLLVVGDCNPDLVLSGGQVRPAFGQAERMVERADLLIGGTSSITACGAARLGLPPPSSVFWATTTSAASCATRCPRQAVDMSALVVDPNTPTGLSVVLTDGEDRATLTAPGTIGAVTAAMVSDDLLRRSRHVHTSGLLPAGRARRSWRTSSPRARAAGRHHVARPRSRPRRALAERPDRALPLIDQLLPNAVEALWPGRHCRRGDSGPAAGRARVPMCW